MNVKYLFFSIIVLLIYGCVPVNEEDSYGQAIQDFDNEKVRDIYRLEQNQELDSLLELAKSKNPLVKYCTAEAFASLKDKKISSVLAALLQFDDMKVQTSAAYAVGQQRDSTLSEVLISIFNANTQEEVNTMLNKNILEAIGKIGNRNHLSLLANSKPYPSQYNHLNLGKALAIYQFGLRNIVDERATSQMVQMIVDKIDGETSMIASNYLSRRTKEELDKYKFQLFQEIKESENVFVRMALASAISKTGSKELLNPFFQFLKGEKDYRVKINALKYAYNFKYIDVIEDILFFLDNQHVQVSMTAYDALAKIGKGGDVSFYLEKVNSASSLDLKIYGLGTILEILDVNYPKTKNKIKRELKNIFQKTQNVYLKKMVIQALGKNISLHSDIVELARNNASPIVRSTAIECLGKMLSQKLPYKSATVARNYAFAINKYLNEAVSSDDAGVVAAAAYAVSHSDAKWCKYIDINKFKEAYASCEIPKELETQYALVDAIQKLHPEDKLSKSKYGFKNQFNYNKFNKYRDTIDAIIQTTEGNISIELYKNNAPSTVQNFINLVHDKFYNGKYFHRVVPNFVIQAGCPRGDGYGSLDYTIRSELSHSSYHDEGYIGMASAGNHTECTQWFITHSPTPHLDGRYTIFGKVSDGMDIVHKIKIGDQIKEIFINQ